MGIWGQLWILWAIYFGVVEGAALISKAPGATLTAHIVSWLSLKGKATGWLFRRAGWLSFLGWLVYHFVVRINW